LPFPSISRWAVPVAAAAALALVVLAPGLRSPARRAPEWLPVAGENTLLRTHANPEARTSLEHALEVYSSGDARAALAALESLEISTSADFESSLRDLYLASALVLNQRPADALALLDALALPTLPEPWRRWGQWTQYVALRDAGRTAEAQALLGTLAGNTNDVGDRARAEMRRQAR
jgi:hypothetical protein